MTRPSVVSAAALLLTTAAAGDIPHNRQPGLLPPGGMWRGASLTTARFGPITNFEKDFGVPMHIFRDFFRPDKTVADDDDKAFVANGGILFYSIQPHPWSDYQPGGSKDDEIAQYAAGVKSLAPAQVMVPVGFEPNHHASDWVKSGQIFGTAKEYVSMYQHFVNIFKQQNVTNAVFVMDFAAGIHKDPDALTALYPGDGILGWVFWNDFESKSGQKNDKGNCSKAAAENYAALEAAKIYADLPWGMGAWGSRNVTFGNPPTVLSDADRKACINGVSDMYKSGAYPKLKASIYFNSLNSLISPRKDVPYGYPELAPTLTSLFHDSVFTQNDV